MTAHVSIDVAGTTVTASITDEAVDELGPTVGGEAWAVVKASDVMVAVDDWTGWILIMDLVHPWV